MDELNQISFMLNRIGWLNNADKSSLTRLIGAVIKEKENEIATTEDENRKLRNLIYDTIRLPKEKNVRHFLKSGMLILYPRDEEPEEDA